ncbi:MAG: AraC family transcriptional regulator [Rhizobacter sp.]
MNVSPLLDISARFLSLSKHGWFYIFDKGFLFACDGLASESVRHTASVLLSLTNEPFEVEVNATRHRGTAFLIRPGVWRRVHASDTPVASLGLCPNHASFRAVSTSSGPEDLWVLPREAFDDCDDGLQAARAGLLSAAGAHSLGALIAQRASQVVAEPPPLDARIVRVLALMEEDLNPSMKRLADEVDLSYHRLSHLFSQEMGITLRLFTISRKLDLAAMMAGQGLSLTQIAIGSGFSDSAHFCRTWMRWVGSPPSQILNSEKVGIRTAYGPH